MDKALDIDVNTFNRMTKFETKLEKLGPVSSNVVNLRGAYHYASTDLNVILQVIYIEKRGIYST